MAPLTDLNSILPLCDLGGKHLLLLEAVVPHLGLQVVDSVGNVTQSRPCLLLMMLQDHSHVSSLQLTTLYSWAT